MYGILMKLKFKAFAFYFFIFFIILFFYVKGKESTKNMKLKHFKTVIDPHGRGPN